jgi:hypothetical protein
LLSVHKDEFAKIERNYPVTLQQNDKVNVVLYANIITEMETKRECSVSV